jgi:hypothetical protein
MKRYQIFKNVAEARTGFRHAVQENRQERRLASPFY